MKSRVIESKSGVYALRGCSKVRLQDLCNRKVSNNFKSTEEFRFLVTREQTNLEAVKWFDIVFSWDLYNVITPEIKECKNNEFQDAQRNSIRN